MVLKLAKKLVIVESPYASKTIDGLRANKLYARACILDCLLRGEAPVAFHMLYTQVLRDHGAQERQLGLDAGIEWQRAADVIAFYEDLGVSPGMKRALKRAERAGKIIEHRKVQSYAMG